MKILKSVKSVSTTGRNKALLGLGGWGEREALPMLELRLLRGLAQVTPVKKIFS